MDGKEKISGKVVVNSFQVILKYKKQIKNGIHCLLYDVSSILTISRLNTHVRQEPFNQVKNKNNYFEKSIIQ